jgi:chromatin segregation and condensation protein Rec8/ScpA/Scc1 (kleisin family)
MVAEPDQEGEGDADGDPSITAAEPTDPRVELVQQLLDYQRYRIVSETLEDRRQAFIRQFPAQPSRAEQEQPEDDAAILELEDAHVYDLYESYERIVSSIDFTRLGDHHVEMDDTPAALYQEDLMDRLGRTPDGRLTLQETFEGCPSPHRLGLFLATLELVRLRRIDVRQDDLLAEIAVELRQEEE